MLNSDYYFNFRNNYQQLQQELWKEIQNNPTKYDCVQAPEDDRRLRK